MSRGLGDVYKRQALDDYPIRIWFQPVTEPSRPSRWKQFPWTASVINWTAISGSGNTKQEAIEELRLSFERFKATKQPLPRPGTKVPIQFAAKDRVDQHSALAKDFVKRVLEIDWAWISDESSLDDFHDDESNKRLVDRVRDIYGVDVSDIPNGNLADIFDKISKDVSAEDLPKR